MQTGSPSRPPASYSRGATVARALAWSTLIGAATVLVRGEVAKPRLSLPDGVLVQEDLVYRSAGSRRARLDLYLPVGVAPRRGRPAVVAIHGGGWRGGSKRDYGPMAAQLARRGYAVLAIDYLLSRPGAPSWPGNLEDVREAVRWARRHAPDYGIDPGRVAVLGASAGGHLAALLGTDPAQGARVQAVIDFYGPSDLLALESSPAAPKAAIHLMLGGNPAQTGTRYERASPLRHVSSDDPPMLLFHGADDVHVPVEQSQALAAALAAAGVSHRLVVLPGFRHGFGFQHDHRDLLPEIVAFLDSVWASERFSSRDRLEPAPRPPGVTQPSLGSPPGSR